MDLPSLGSHMGLPLPEPSQNRCCLWNQNSAIIHGIKPLRRLTPPTHPFRGESLYIALSKYFSPLKGYSPVRGNGCDSRQKGARFQRKRCHEVTEGFQPTNNNLPSDFLLGHQGKSIPESYPGSGVATRQTIIYRPTSCSGTRVNPFPNPIPGVVSPRYCHRRTPSKKAAA